MSEARCADQNFKDWPNSSFNALVDQGCQNHRSQIRNHKTTQINLPLDAPKIPKLFEIRSLFGILELNWPL